MPAKYSWAVWPRRLLGGPPASVCPRTPDPPGLSHTFPLVPALVVYSETLLRGPPDPVTPQQACWLLILCHLMHPQASPGKFWRQAGATVSDPPSAETQFASISMCRGPPIQGIFFPVIQICFLLPVTPSGLFLPPCPPLPAGWWAGAHSTSPHLSSLLSLAPSFSRHQMSFSTGRVLPLCPNLYSFPA